jgi:hypothetical protein
MPKRKRAEGTKVIGSGDAIRRLSAGEFVRGTSDEVANAFAVGAARLRRFGQREGASPSSRARSGRGRTRRGPGQHG